jgi:2-methyl-3-hydroxypyridine 5-carboxylic acid dioxygenase
MPRKRHAEIAGGGFAGLTAAIALKQRGWSVRVHEASPALREFGAGIFIWDNGLRVLKAIGAHDAVVAGAHQAPYYETRRQGSVVARAQFGDAVDCRMLTMTRQLLYSAILDPAKQAGIEFVTASTVIRATPEGELWTEDGRRFKADLIIGADGVKSSVRESLGIPTERRIFDDGVIRLLAGRPTTMRGGDWDNVLDLWSGGDNPLRILYVPCSPVEVYLCMLAPRTHARGSAIPVDKAVWIDAIPELEPILRSLGSQGRYDPYEMTKVRSWSAGRVALVGDSANGMPPTLGQGAGCAMMNALALAVALDEADSIEDAIALWERRERPITDATQDKACLIAATRKLREGSTFNADSDALATARHIPTGSPGTPILSPRIA